VGAAGDDLLVNTQTFTFGSILQSTARAAPASIFVSVVGLLFFHLHVGFPTSRRVLA